MTDIDPALREAVIDALLATDIGGMSKRGEYEELSDADPRRAEVGGGERLRNRVRDSWPKTCQPAATEGDVAHGIAS